MPRGTVIYLHGANDAGLGFVSNACKPDGAIARACKERGFSLRNPIAGVLPVAWHRDPLLADIRRIVEASTPPHFLAGHSLGGRGALLIGLRGDEFAQKFRAIGAIAPALGQGPMDGPVLEVSGVDTFTGTHLRAALPEFQKPVFLAYSSFDPVVGQLGDVFDGLTNKKRKHRVEHYMPLSLDQHDALIAASAKDLMRFFASVSD